MLFNVPNVNGNFAYKQFVASESQFWCGMEWKIRVYPNGINLDTVDFDGKVVVILELLSKAELQLDFRLSIINQLDNKLTKTSHCLKNNYSRKKRTVLYGAFGMLTYVQLSEAGSGYCVDGTMLVDVDFSGNNDVVKNYRTSNWYDNGSRMYISGRYSDVVVTVGNIEIPSHKCILGMKSPVFDAMFTNEMTECISNKIIINDFSVEVVKSFLHCLYNSQAVDKELQAHAEQLYVIANKYQVDDLVVLAELYISEQITVDNVINTLQFAQFHNNQVIKTASFSFVVDNSIVVLKLPNLLDTLGTLLSSELLAYLAENMIKKETA